MCRGNRLGLLTYYCDTTDTWQARAERNQATWYWRQVFDQLPQRAIVGSLDQSNGRDICGGRNERSRELRQL